VINQREVGLDTKSYHNALINAMREAPDILMIGEVRDKETLQQALLYAQTGHLCLTTLHANNSYHALNRIINFFPYDARPSLLHDLAVCLKAIISQRLVKSVDGSQVAAVEVLLNSKHIAELIVKGETDQIREAIEKSLSPGSVSFEQALFKLYADGKITKDEALRNSDSATNLSWLMNNAEQVASTTKSEVSKVTRGADINATSFDHFKIDINAGN
jgi:twitching motility protein PilU